jgi:hypothetical protein
MTKSIVLSVALLVGCVTATVAQTCQVWAWAAVCPGSRHLLHLWSRMGRRLVWVSWSHDLNHDLRIDIHDLRWTTGPGHV